LDKVLKVFPSKTPTAVHFKLTVHAKEKHSAHDLREKRGAIDRRGWGQPTVNQVNTGFHGGNALDTLHRHEVDPSAVPDRHGELLWKNQRIVFSPREFCGRQR